MFKKVISALLTATLVLSCGFAASAYCGGDFGKQNVSKEVKNFMNKSTKNETIDVDVELDDSVKNSDEFIKKCNERFNYVMNKDFDKNNTMDKAYFEMVKKSVEQDYVKEITKKCGFDIDNFFCNVKKNVMGFINVRNGWLKKLYDKDFGKKIIIKEKHETTGTIDTIETLDTVDTLDVIKSHHRRGDCNFDDKINGKDSMQMRKLLSGDIRKIIDTVLEYVDTNSDGKFNGKDSLTLRRQISCEEIEA